MKCNLCQRQFKTAQALSQHKAALHRQPSRPTRVAAPAPRRMAVPRQMPEGELVISRTELLTTITIAKDKSDVAWYHSLLPDTKVLVWLAGLTKAFDQIVWERAEVMWKPCVGTTFNGSIILGVDWNAAATDASRTKAAACSPSLDTPLWRPANIVLPPSRLQSRKAYILSAVEDVDKSPCVILANVKSTTQSADTCVGDVWLKYTVRLIGPSA